MIYGNRVRELREKLSLTKRELADRVCVSVSTISKWENWESTPQSFNLSCLARELDTTEEYLMGLTDNPLSIHTSLTNIRANAVEQPRPFVPVAVAEMPKANATRGEAKKSFYWASMIFTAFIALLIYVMTDLNATRGSSYRAVNGHMIDAVKQGTDTRRYVLAGVVAPHVAKTSEDTPSEPFGDAAKDFIVEIVKSNDLYVEFLGGNYAYFWLGKPEDSSDVETIKTQMLNALMISNGFSKYRHPHGYTINTAYNAVFEALQKEAQDNRVGIWSLPENSPEALAKAEAERLKALAKAEAERREAAKKAEQERKRQQAEEEKERKKEQQEYLRAANQVVVTPRGKKYHHEWCHTIKGSYRTLTIKQAKRRGYTACKVCSPPSQEVTLENSNIYWGNDVYYGGQ